MLKNILLPFVLIVLTSALTIYFFYDGPLFAILGFLTLGFGGMYISCYVFYRLFPDDRNKPLPSFLQLLSEYEKNKKGLRKNQSNKKVQKAKAVITIGSTIAFISTIVMVIGGIYLWYDFAAQYRKYQLQNYGKYTKGVIIDKGYRKHPYREYEFRDQAGHKHTNHFSNETLNIGDSVEIFYSTQRPDINER